MMALVQVSWMRLTIFSCDKHREFTDATGIKYCCTGLLAPRVPEVFLPLKQSIEILGASLQPKSAQAILDQCLQGITQKVTASLDLRQLCSHLACYVCIYTPPMYMQE